MADERTKVTDDTDEVGLVEKAFLVGLGAATMAKEKAQELAEDLVARGKMSRDQSESFVNRLLDRTSQAAGTMGFASKKDLDAMHEELTEMKTLIASLRPMNETPKEP